MNTMELKIKRTYENAVLPKKAYDKDFCYDLVAVTEEEIAPDVWKYGFGLAFQIVRDTKDSSLNLSIDIRPRSSVWETGMVLSNSVGTIDEGYTNEISAVFYHVNKNLPRYKVGDRIAQMKIGATFPIDFIEVEELDETERGLRGYGSSGK